MEEQKASYQTFEDLDASKIAREFRKAMYRAAKQLPKTEKFGLVGQVRRAALSLTNNIAEGHGRFHFPDQIKFILQARGSLEELIDGLNVCEDEAYLQTVEIEKLKQEAWRVHRLINGYIRFLRNRISGSSGSVQESPAEEYNQEELDELCSNRFTASTLQPFNE